LLLRPIFRQLHPNFINVRIAYASEIWVQLIKNLLVKSSAERLREYIKKQQEEKSMAGILTALLSGALMSIQGVFNTEVTKQTSTWLAAGWVQISAFAVCLAAWCITGREPIGDLFRVKPWYLLLGGAIGAFITITVIWSMAGLGPAKAAMLIVISQLAAAWLIELFGLFGMEKTDFTVRKLIGMAIAVVGIVVFQWE
jgi:transporter family-2 protein